MEESELGLQTFGNIAECLPGVLYRCDADNTFSSVSKGCLELTGYPSSYLRGAGFGRLNALVHPDDRSHIEGQRLQNAGKEGTFEYQYRIVCKSGQIKWVTERSERTFDGASSCQEGYIFETAPACGSLGQESRWEESEELRRVLAAMPDELLQIELSGRCKLLKERNGEFCLTGDWTTLSECYPPAVVHQFLRCTEMAIAWRQVISFQYALADAQDQKICFEARISRWSESEVIAVIRDVTAQTRAQEETESLKDFYASVINNVNIDVTVLDSNNRYVFVNHSAARNPAIRKWLIGKDDQDYSRMQGGGVQVAEARMRMYKLADELKEPVEWLEDVKDANGCQRFFARTLTPFVNAAQEYKLAYGVDITALKVIQDELQRREHLLAFSHELAKIGYWVSYSRNGKQEWSDGIYDILEIERGSIIPSPESFLSIIHPDDRAEVRKKRDFFLNNNTTLSMEYRIISGKGQVKYIKEESSSNTLDTDTYICVVVQDITDIKKHIRERDELLKEIRKKYQDLMQFNYIISHNLRSPVANILGMSSLLKMDLEDDERAQVFDFITESAEAIDGVIRDLNLLLSVKSALNEKKENVRLTEVIRSVKRSLRLQIHDCGATISSKITGDADLIYSIKGYVQSIIFNLISNAIKYRVPGRKPLVKIKGWRDEKGFHISVEDNGRGIDLKRHNKELFGLYKRFSPDGEGKGLGLHMTKTQVESLNGTIEVESEEGVGTVFTVSFPL